MQNAEIAAERREGDACGSPDWDAAQHHRQRHQCIHEIWRPLKTAVPLEITEGRARIGTFWRSAERRMANGMIIATSKNTMACPPADIGDGTFEYQPPDGAREVAAARDQRERRAAAAVEPAADIDVERRFDADAKEANEQALTEQKAARLCQPDADHQRAEHHRPAHAEPLLAHMHAAAPKPIQANALPSAGTERSAGLGGDLL